MTEDRPSTGSAPGTPSAEEIKERIAGADSGAGNKEPDPATAEDPPHDLKAGDEKRG